MAKCVLKGLQHGKIHKKKQYMHTHIQYFFICIYAESPNHTIYMHVYIHNCLHVYAPTNMIHTIQHISTYILAYIHLYIHTCIHVYACTNMIHTINTFLHTYMHAYIQVYIHTYIPDLRITLMMTTCNNRLTEYLVTAVVLLFGSTNSRPSMS